MNRTLLYVILAILLIAVGILGYNYYQSQQQSTGVQINLDQNGLSVQSN